MRKRTATSATTLPFAWRYRDYVINAFNKDKPYDQFLREQLAGDLLPDASPESWTATGYYRLGIWDDEPADPLQARYDVLDGIVSTTAQVILGMSVWLRRRQRSQTRSDPAARLLPLAGVLPDVTNMNTKNTRFVASPADRLAYEKAVREHRQSETKTDAELRADGEGIRPSADREGTGRHFSSVDLSRGRGSGAGGGRPQGEGHMVLHVHAAGQGMDGARLEAKDWRRGPGGFDDRHAQALVGTVWNGKDVRCRTFEVSELPAKVASTSITTTTWKSI